MALIDCPTCGGELAGSARRCPHCGATSPRTQSNRRALVFVVVATAVITAVCFLLLNSSLFDAPNRLSITNSVTAP